MSLEVRQQTLRGLRTGWLHCRPAVAEGAPLLVFLHGFPDTPEAWDRQFAYFEDKFEIIAPYIRGVAPSEAGRDLRRFTTEAVALDVLQILDGVDPDKRRPIAIIGHDLGAVHAWSIARLLKGRVRGLVILNGLTLRQMLKRLRQPAQLAKSWYIFAMQLPLLPEMMLSRFAERFLKQAHKTGGLSVKNAPTISPKPADIAASAQQYRAFFRQAVTAWREPTRRLRCKTLIIWGSNDAFLVTPNSAEFSNDAADVTVRILDGNHWLHRERADEINRLLATFFATIFSEKMPIGRQERSPQRSSVYEQSL